MSRLGRLVVSAALPLTVGRSDVPVFAGFYAGEFTSGVGFLRGVFLRGATLASPLAFPNTVHNAPAAHLAIAGSLSGPSETVLGGPDTLWRLLERALCHVSIHAEPVIVVVADEGTAEVRDGFAMAGLPPVPEAAAAVLLGPAEGVHPRLNLYTGAPPPHLLRGGPGPARELIELLDAIEQGRAVAGPGLWLEGS